MLWQPFHNAGANEHSKAICCVLDVVFGLLARFINEAVRRWLWGIHLHQRLRVPPGFPSFSRMPVVMLLQLGAPTLCWCKRTPQSHLLYTGNSVCLIASYGVAVPKPGLETICLMRGGGCQVFQCQNQPLSGTLQRHSCKMDD